MLPVVVAQSNSDDNAIRYVVKHALPLPHLRPHFTVPFCNTKAYFVSVNVAHGGSIKSADTDLYIYFGPHISYNSYRHNNSTTDSKLLLLTRTT